MNDIPNNAHSFDAFMSTNDWRILYHILGSTLFELDTLTGSKADININLSLTSPADLEGHVSGEIYVISATGRLDRSTNNGTLFDK